MAELKLLSGGGNDELARDIADEIRRKTGHDALGELALSKFSDGEIDVKIAESVRGEDVFVIQPTCRPVNENLMRLFIILDALRRASAGRITAVIPYYGYARKEKKTQPRDPITAKLMANIITLAGANRILTVDLHSDAIQGFFDIPVDHLTAVKLIAEFFEDMRGREAVIVAPDGGGIKRARMVARLLELPLAIIDKRRTMDEEVDTVRVIGDVGGCHAVVVDDMITTGKTLVHDAEALIKEGATAVSAAATHAVFAGEAVSNLRNSKLSQVVVTDTIPLPAEAETWPGLRRLSMAPLLADAILRVHEDRSVSELFKDRSLELFR